MPKITRATFKSFVNKNRDRLFIKTLSRFDGMSDCVAEVKDDFSPAIASDYALKQPAYTLGLHGIWLVGQGRDYFESYEDKNFKGYEVFNCCGSFIVATKTETDKKARLEYLRQELRAGTMSYGELAELQSLAKYIDAGDVELLEAAGVPEFPDETCNCVGCDTVVDPSTARYLDGNPLCDKHAYEADGEGNQ